MIALLVAGGDTGLVSRLHVPVALRVPVALHVPVALVALVKSISGAGLLFARLLPKAARANGAHKAAGLKALTL